MSRNKDEILEASKIACETWNDRNPRNPVAIGVISYHLRGSIIAVDGSLNFYLRGQRLDGEFLVGNYNTSWETPMELVYGWLECIEESYHFIFEKTL